MTELIPPVRTLAALSPAERNVVRALRVWAMAARRKGCPLQAAAEPLGSLRAAAHLHLLLEEIGGAWPDPFTVSPPCCDRISHDEATFADMIRLGARRDRSGFDRLLNEMLPAYEREKLFLSASVLGRVLE